MFDCSWLTRLKGILNSRWIKLCTVTCSCEAKQGKGLLFVVHEGFKFQINFAEISFWRKTRPANLVVIGFVHCRPLTRRLDNDFTFVRNNDTICSRVTSTASVFKADPDNPERGGRRNCGESEHQSLTKIDFSQNAAYSIREAL